MVNLLLVSWNCDGLSICESTSEKKIKEKRDRVFFPRKECTPPQFFEPIRKRLTSEQASKQPDIFVITTQEESKSSYLHTEYLPNVVEEIAYVRIIYKSFEVTEDSSLRISIFVKASIFGQVTFAKSKTLPLLLVGGLGIINYIQLADKVYAFTAIQNTFPLPDSNYEDSDLISIFTANTAISLTYLLKFVNEDGDLSSPVDYSFLIGEFKTTINNGQPSSTIIYELGQAKNYTRAVSYDTMKTVLSFPSLWWLREGTNNGPNFAPTWPMVIGRDPKCGNFGCYDPTIGRIGWTNRILHSSYQDEFYSQNPCVEYYSTNVDGITSSSSDMVIGVYKTGQNLPKN